MNSSRSEASRILFQIQGRISLQIDVVPFTMSSPGYWQSLSKSRQSQRAGRDFAINSAGIINVLNLNTSVDATCPAPFHANGGFLLLSFYPSSSWFQRLPCQHLSFHDFNSCVTLILHWLLDDCSTLQMEFRIGKVIDRKRIRVAGTPLHITWLRLSTNTCCTCHLWVVGHSHLRHWLAGWRAGSAEFILKFSHALAASPEKNFYTSSPHLFFFNVHWNIYSSSCIIYYMWLKLDAVEI